MPRRIWTFDTRIFSPMLYLLSYLGLYNHFMANLILFIVMFLFWFSLNEVFISIFSNTCNLKVDLIFLFENFLENLPLTFFFEILIVYFYFLCYRSENIFTSKNIIILILLILLVGKKDISSIYLIDEYSYKKSFENIFA